MSDLAEGQVFGAWKVLKLASDGRYLCLCTSCNDTQKRVKKHDLVSGKSRLCKSCASSTSRSHGAEHKHSSEYQSWLSMLARCTNPNNKDYPNYGGRGITVYPMWRDSFEAFFMMMGKKPDDSYTIERKDSNGNYEPKNCTWATRAEQNRNTRSNVFLTIGNETKVVTEWARDPRCTVSEFTIYKRHNRGWSDERAVFEPSQGGGKETTDGEEEEVRLGTGRSDSQRLEAAEEDQQPGEGTAEGT